MKRTVYMVPRKFTTWVALFLCVLPGCTATVESGLVDATPPLYHLIVDGATLAQIRQKLDASPKIVGVVGQDGQTNLYYAVREERADVVKLLMEKGEDPNIFSYESPLLCAVKTGNNEIIKLLLKGGADPRKRSPPGISPYELAKEKQHTGIVRMFDDVATKRKARTGM